jgi:hypothetical protein
VPSLLVCPPRPDIWDLQHRGIIPAQVGASHELGDVVQCLPLRHDEGWRSLTSELSRVTLGARTIVQLR